MAKDPAFLFYPGDYISGTMGMTFEEKGAYIELLMMQFNRGHMTSHMIELTVGQIWGQIKSKFTQDADGLWYNVRLDLEKENRKTFTESRKNNLSGKNQYTNKKGHKKGHTTSHMEDENKDLSLGSNNIDIINGFFENLKNGREIENIAITLEMPLEKVKIKLEEFKKFAETSYLDYAKFVTHFKNWLRKNPQINKSEQVWY